MGMKRGAALGRTARACGLFYCFFFHCCEQCVGDVVPSLSHSPTLPTRGVGGADGLCGAGAVGDAAWV